MKNKLYLLYAFVAILVILVSYFYIKNSSAGKNNQVDNQNSTSGLQITAETATSTNQVSLAMLKEVAFNLPGNTSKPILGDIILQKEFSGNNDIIAFAYILDSKNKKLFYLLQFREISGVIKLISSSRIDGAEEIIGLRAADASSPTEYYIDIQVRPSGSQDTQGAIKTIGVKGIQEDTTL